MANESPYKQEFRIRDLPTRSVLLFPTRAQVIRDIKEITLHPGANQIVIDGLAPTVDEHSIKVEGTGSATITDVTVELLPNREVWEDVYPEADEDDDFDSEDESEDEDPGLKAINDKIKQYNIQLAKEQEKINSGAQRLAICDTYGRSVERNPPSTDALSKVVAAYEEERLKIFQEHEDATAASEIIQENINKAEKEKTKLAKELAKARVKKLKLKEKEKEKKIRKKVEILKEKQRIKAERESFWPRKVYCITINLEPTGSDTPGSSRRNSIDGDTVVNLATTTFHETPASPLKTGDISLSLSYITYSASWSPRYDLSLNTITNTGILEYGAELINTTSETWSNAKVILSTSQTTFSGLSETIPTLVPWHVRLYKGGRNADSALFSSHEMAAKKKEWSTSTGEATQKPRHEIFGRNSPAYDPTAQNYQQRISSQAEKQKKVTEDLMQRGSRPTIQSFGHDLKAYRGSNIQLLSSSEAYSRSRKSVGGFGSLFGGGRGGRAPMASASALVREKDEEAEQSDEDCGFGLFDGDESAPPVPGALPAPTSLTFEEGAWEESGMTTTYDVPGFKTLVPSNSTTKHKIAKVTFKNVIFSHIVIGKLRQVAFLKARLRNTSKITLLKGPLGLTLDGSFLGQASFPRCSAGESFSLPLGIDPSITVNYPKPTVRRSQTGIFSKEDSNVFTRTVTILNTNQNKLVEMTVLDQVPVSEDERLKIEVLNPRGLKVGSDGAVRTGVSVIPEHPALTTVPTNTSVATAGSTPAKGSAKDVRASVYAEGNGANGKSKSEGWGTAIATAKKGGEVSWSVKLNPGQGVKLSLEYEATFPGGETVIGVNGV